MGFSGTLVVARPQDRLTDQPGIGGFGFRHPWLSEELWAAVHRPDTDVPALVARISEVRAMIESSPDDEVLRFFLKLYPKPAAGTWDPEDPRDIMARRWFADRWATET